MYNQKQLEYSRKYERSEKGRLTKRLYQQSRRGKISKLKSYLKRHYDLTLDAYYELIKNQNNKCIICLKEFEEFGHNGPHVDHNHETHKVRGLLCHYCNIKLGWYEKFKIIIENYINSE